MKMLTLSLSLALMQLFAAQAQAAQPKNDEAVPPGTPVPATKPKATAAEKAQGKATRKLAGAEAAREAMPGEGNPVPASTARIPKAQRREAAAQRNAETRRANKAGEITSKGETGYTK